jgi:D-beta-D-heptose 7-phosphate kinase / D-beta-D-heptose 1-phosphate adenosyltransferase
VEGNIFERDKTMTLSKIIDYYDLDQLVESLKKLGGRVVLVGGCFDILHIGHIRFLNKAKEHGDILVVALESDEKTKKIKGDLRPINTQDIRAEIIANLSMVDFVLKLAPNLTDADYLDFTRKIAPQVLAVSEASTLEQKAGNYQIQMVASSIGAKFVEVTEIIKGFSTSRLARELGME